ncbi:hypothetical protein BH18ACI4_BH18ACI4_16140 [soil metagenome]
MVILVGFFMATVVTVAILINRKLDKRAERTSRKD